MDNVASKLVIRSLIQGNNFSKEIEIEKGTVTSFSGGIEDKELFIKFESYIVANRIYKLDFETPLDEIKVFCSVTTKFAEKLTLILIYSWKFWRKWKFQD